MQYNEILTPLTNLHELCRRLELPESLAQNAQGITDDYPLLVPDAFVRKIEKGNANDPLLLQILPQSQELEEVDGFCVNPLQERITEFLWPHDTTNAIDCNICTKKTQLLKKYENRVLLLASDECAVHCRYCFRRNLKNERNDSQRIYETLNKFPSVSEVVLSGGDPLCLSDEELKELLHKICRIPSVRRVRIHTRYPVVEPRRWTQSLLQMLRSDRKTVFSLVLHINHPRELDTTFETAVCEAVDWGIPIFAQSVLLHGVNDSAVTLFELYEKLISVRIHPYYLHQLDRVSGTAHFEVSPQKGLELMNTLRQKLPGYAVPKYVREIPGKVSKIEVGDRREAGGGRPEV